MCNPKSLKNLGGTSAQVARGISGPFRGRGRGRCGGHGGHFGGHGRGYYNNRFHGYGGYGRGNFGGQGGHGNFGGQGSGGHYSEATAHHAANHGQQVLSAPGRRLQVLYLE
jgi:hypothetical protein